MVIESLTAINAAIQLVPSLIKMADALKNSELKLAIADLTLKLADTKIAMSQLIEVNNELRKQLSELLTLTLKDRVYWKEDGTGPFCPHCYHNRKLSYLSPTPIIAVADLGKYTCAECKNHWGLIVVDPKNWTI